MPLFEAEPFERLAAEVIFPDYRFGLHALERAEKLVDLGVGGFCLFNGQAEEIASFTEAMQKRSARPLIFCADYESGTGRLAAGGTSLPWNMAFGAAGEDELAYLKGRVTGREAKALGVDWVFAPVVDLATRPDNPIVNTRAFGSDPKLVTRLARAYLKGLKEAGAAGCLKHFPGHGETSLDSHLELPVLERSLAQLEAAELVPYRELAKDADSVMLGHLLLPGLDPDEPASLSAKAVGLLRGLGFEGLVVTDAMMMGAVVKRYGAQELAVRALRAGADVVLIPADPFETHAALTKAVEDGRLSIELLEARSARIETLRHACGLGSGSPRRGGASALGLPESALLVGQVAQRALCWHGGPWTALRAEAAYLELGAEADAPKKGKAMLERLKRLGVPTRAWTADWKGPTVAASFTSPRAYAGSVNLSEADVERVRQASGSGPTALVSFGSPFVAEQVGVPALLAFSDEPPMQQAAAGILAGKETAQGAAPVRLRPQPSWAVPRSA